jgi:DNA polymerase-3 subunit alpha
VGDDVLATDLPQLVGKSVTVVGYLVTIKPSRTAKGERMYFGTFLDRAGNFLDTVHFPPISERYAWRGKGIYIIKGKVSEEFGAISIEAQYLEKIRLKDDPRYA